MNDVSASRKAKNTVSFLKVPILALAATSVSLTFAAGAQTPPSAYLITTLSSRPDMVSGGDALVQVTAPASADLKKPVIKLNGEDVTRLFRPDAAAHTLTGLVGGLKTGTNTLEVSADKKSHGSAAQMTLVNHSITGPILAGPQEHPFICQTNAFKLPDGRSLGDPVDANCSVATVVSYVYKSTQPASKEHPAIRPLPSLTSLPTDVAMTTTSAGQTVPYVVRVETGTIDRSIYQIAMLHDPTTEGSVAPFAKLKGWNGRLMYSFGGGCPGGWYRQGATLGSEFAFFAGGGNASSAVVNDDVVGKGYAEASSSLNVAGNNCNEVISTEAMMMVKEHFVKVFGKPAFTLGRGMSGGSYQQNQIADKYPGLLDGLIVGMTFPDVQELVQMLTDSRLLDTYFTKAGDGLTEEQKRAISGVAELDNIPASAPLAGRINPTEYCPPAMPQEQRYDKDKNRGGVRCDIYDHNINLYGKDPATGFARRPVDNVGVQYGLGALNSGAINVAQFLDLNEKIGGYDSDGYVSQHRSVADTLGLRAAYQNDLITYGSELAKVPIIDVRPYRDKLPKGDNHLKYHSFTLRARLENANGTYANDVMLTSDMDHFVATADYAIAEMDQWVTNLGKDSSNDVGMDKILRAKPADLVDSCWTSSGERIIEAQTYSGGKCNELYPTFPSPRMVAGGSLLNSNILKCQLRPIDASDYKVPLSDVDKARLATIFPGGVCDWSKPGVEQQPPAVGVWHSY